MLTCLMNIFAIISCLERQKGRSPVVWVLALNFCCILVLLWFNIQDRDFRYILLTYLVLMFLIYFRKYKKGVKPNGS